MSTSTEDVFECIEREKPTYLEELRSYLQIPSISTDPEYRPEVERCSDFVLEEMRRVGLEAEKITTDGHPLVYGEWTQAPGKPTVLFYGHYDVQPVDPLDLWRHPPFEPTVEGDHLVARGATDDKGQSFTHLKAVDSILRTRGTLPVNVKFLIEGEEESGGASIDRYVDEDQGRRLACDCVVISDSSMYKAGQPALLYGLKGLLYTEIRVTGPNRDLHSGSFGGAVTNPVNALCEIVAKLRDSRTGEVLIPGFYDDVRPLEDWERRQFSELDFDEADYSADLGVTELVGERGYTTLERVWARPTCDVNGIFGGYQGPGAKTVLPATCGAKVSMRLVPDQDPGTVYERLSAYIREVTPPGVTVEVEKIHDAGPVLVDLDGPLADAAMDAMEDVWGRRPVKVREGGSIPIVSTMSRVLKVPVLLLGFGLPDDRLHSPNEKFNISHFYQGIRSIARFLDRLGD